MRVREYHFSIKCGPFLAWVIAWCVRPAPWAACCCCDAKSEVLSCSYFATFHPFSAPESWLTRTSMQLAGTLLLKLVGQFTVKHFSDFQASVRLNYLSLFLLDFLPSVFHSPGLARLGPPKKYKHWDVSEYIPYIIRHILLLMVTF